MARYKFNNSGLTLDKLFDQTLVRRPEGIVKDLSLSASFEDFYNDIVLYSSAINRFIGKDNVVSVMCWNNIDFAKMMYSIPLSGNVIHPVDVRQSPDQILETMRQAGTKYIFASHDFLPFVEMSVSKQVVKDGNVMMIDRNPIDEKYSSFYEKINKTVNSSIPSIDENTIASVLFTSGTTGKPKGVRYRHRDIVLTIWAMLTNLSAFSGPARLNSDDRIMSLIPFFHLWSWGTLFMSTMIGSDYIMSGKFDVSKTLEIMQKDKITWMSMVPTMFNSLSVEKSDNPFKNVKILIGGSAIPSSIIHYATNHNIELTGIYGFTDGLGAAIGTAENCDVPHKEQCLHRAVDKITPLVMTEFETEGENSEIKFRSSWLPSGYFNLKDENGTAYREGWFYPGDVGTVSREGIKITDRIKDLIKSGGEFIPSAEIEYYITNLPEILDVAVIGYPDEKWGERPIALYRTKQGSNIEESRIREYLTLIVNEGAIKKWWIPDRYIRIDNMPMTGTGKIDKKALKNMISNQIHSNTKYL